MIEIRKVQDEKTARMICAENRVEWSPEVHVIATIEGGEVLTSAVFSYRDNVGEIHGITGFDGDLAMLDGLCRAILNIMDINGVKDVYLPGKYDELAKKVGFEKAGHRFFLPLDGFFSCGCCKNGGEAQ